MTCDEFCEIYWAHYVSLEKEFLKTTEYVTLHEDNYDAYSEAYLKLLLSIGSETDVVMKAYCRLLDSTNTCSKIDEYRTCIMAHSVDFFTQDVSVKEGTFIIKPWDNVDGSGSMISPFWWNAYNKCKHNRAEESTINSVKKESYKFANLKYTLDALAGLYQTLIYSYYFLAENQGETVKTPLPGSRLFKLIGNQWDDVSFYGDFAFYVDNGAMVIQSSTVYY